MNAKDLEKFKRPWGSYTLLYSDNEHWTKILTIKPGGVLSLQYHKNRWEFWTPLGRGLLGTIGKMTVVLKTNTRYDIPPGKIHRIENPTKKSVRLIEVARGNPREHDIVRVEDKYGRV